MLQKQLELTKTSWMESLEVFKPQSLGRLALLSFRTLLQIYTAVPFAWFFPTALIAGVLFSNLTLAFAFYLVLIARAARPSIEYKRTHYWGHFMPTDWVLFAFIYAYQVIPSLDILWDHPYVLAVYHMVAKLFLLEGNTWLAGNARLEPIIPFLSPFIVIWTLFMLDSQKTVLQYIKSFFRALTMLFYNFPFFLISYEVMRLILAGGFYLSRYTPLEAPIGWVLLLVVFIPLYIAWLTTFYVKRVHEQFSLYYKA